MAMAVVGTDPLDDRRVVPHTAGQVSRKKCGLLARLPQPTQLGEREGVMPLSARNQLKGTVMSVKKGTVRLKWSLTLVVASSWYQPLPLAQLTACL